MNEMNIFEIASREKFRFWYHGLIATEDLWDLDKEDLDQIFKALNREVRSVEEESLLTEKSECDKTLQLKIAIIKYIVNYKCEEYENQKKDIAKRQEKKRIREIISKKEDEDLKSKSIEELNAMLDALEE